MRMVTVKTENELFDGCFTKLFKDLYIRFSDRNFPYELPYPKELSLYLDGLYQSYDKEYKLVENKFNIKIPNKKFDIHDDRVIVAFSGGKDSLADVLVLQELGYKPILWFTKGINRSYTNEEYEHSKILADKLGLEMIVYTVHVSGKCDFFENPVKNQFILAQMVDYGLKKGISNYSFGTYIDAYLDEISTDYMLSDGTYMFENVQEFYNAFIPELDIVIPLISATEAWYEICRKDTHLLLDTYSCMTPLRYKKNLIKNNEKKYNIKILDGRCGSCYKCCNELAVLTYFGVLDYPDEFIKHCKDVTLNFYARYKSKELMDEITSSDWVDEEYIKKLSGLKDKEGYKIIL